METAPLTDLEILGRIQEWTEHFTDDRPLHEYIGITWAQLDAWFDEKKDWYTA